MDRPTERGGGGGSVGEAPWGPWV